ncbi:hypothetical protein HQ571_01090 [Candidatus Kuenenbacteria bacterium]|nr:hypothetical protein [Candidatus Kuenenbacteria bacterium]
MNDQKSIVECLGMKLLERAKQLLTNSSETREDILKAFQENRKSLQAWYCCEPDTAEFELGFIFHNGMFDVSWQLDHGNAVAGFESEDELLDKFYQDLSKQLP